MISNIIKEDIKSIYAGLTDKEKDKLKGSRILITGFAGSLGHTLLHFFEQFKEELDIKKVYGIDNYSFGKPDWINYFLDTDYFDLRKLDVTSCDLEFAKDADFIFHMASMASPVFYRQYPLETIDADVMGLRNLLDFYKDKSIKGFLFYSTSEVYGDPAIEMVPTPESYWGNVNTCGPRACYDESKRFGETLCYTFYNKYQMPLRIVRPFNNYGPGMRLNDQRVVADFAKAIVYGEDIVLYSDGTATRTFDYIPDATVGYLKCILYGDFEIFNIGSDEREITILELAEVYLKIGKDLIDYQGKILFMTHEDRHYLTDNPKRRCPNITKAKELLGYYPKMDLETGILRYLKYSFEMEARKE